MALNRWDLSWKKRFQEISLGSSQNITIQVSLIYSWSYVKIDYGTMNQGLDSGKENKINSNLFTYFVSFLL